MKCKWCPQPVLFREHVETGRSMPIDPDPTPDGNVVLLDGGLYRIRRKDEVGAFFMSHFVTCPERNKARKKRKGG